MATFNTVNELYKEILRKEVYEPWERGELGDIDFYTALVLWEAKQLNEHEQWRKEKWALRRKQLALVMSFLGLLLLLVILA